MKLNPDLDSKIINNKRKTFFKTSCLRVSKLFQGNVAYSFSEQIHGFHNSTVRLKTRDYSKFSCLFT